MLPYDPTGKMGPKKPLPDNVCVVEPKEEVAPSQPSSEPKVIKEGGLPPTAAMAV